MKRNFMRIGTVEISHPVALGPMAGVTDLPFRRLCREMGCGLLYTEMVSAKALSYHNKNTEPILETEDGEHPLAVQPVSYTHLVPVHRQLPCLIPVFDKA